MNREKLAWAAGLFDGEGCFYFKLRRRSDGALDRNAQTRINQTIIAILWKWMGPVKREQARAVLTQQRENRPQQKGRPLKPRQFQLQS